MGTQTIPDWLNEEVAEYDIPLQEPPKTVLDIGANVGAFSLRAAQLWPECRIDAYEPVPENAEAYRNNCGNGRFQLHQAALRSFTGKDSFRLGEKDLKGSFHDLKEQTDKRIEVECLDASNLVSAEFVKIDTEGCEVEILKSLPLDKTRAIACEFHRKQDEHDIRHFLADKGFALIEKRLTWIDKGVLKFVRKGEKIIERKKKLFIGIPIYGGVDPHFFLSAMKMMAEFSVNCHIRPIIGDSLISRARNFLTKQFLNSDCSHMLMIDSDLSFTSDHIKRILSHDLDVVGAFYPKKKEGEPELVFNPLVPSPPPDEERRLMQVKYIGTGFLCVSRRVFTKMIEVMGNDISYISDIDATTVEYDFWPVGTYQYPDGFRRYLSEDWYFCQRCLDLGFTVWGDYGIPLRHSGNALYPLSYQEPQLFRRVAANASSDSAPPVSLSPAQPVAAST